MSLLFALVVGAGFIGLISATTEIETFGYIITINVDKTLFIGVPVIIYLSSKEVSS